MDLLTPDFGVFFWQSIILFVVLLILRIFAWKPILNTIKSRENFISDAIIKAEESHRRADLIQNECDTMLDDANKKKDAILNSALTAKNDIMKKAESDAELVKSEIISSTEKAMDVYRQDVINSSKENIMSMSVQIAEKLMAKELQDENKQKEFLSMLMDYELSKKA